jgi:hypothetical protein
MQKQRVALSSKEAEAKTNDEIISEYFEAMQTEINPSVNYRDINRNTLNRLSRFYKNKPLKKMKREDILAYLISQSMTFNLKTL